MTAERRLFVFRLSMVLGEKNNLNSYKSMVDVSCFAFDILYKVINNLEISFMHYELVEICLHTDNYRPISLFKIKINNGKKNQKTSIAKHLWIGNVKREEVDCAASSRSLEGRLAR